MQHKTKYTTMKWQDFHYLKDGTLTQRLAFEALTQSRIFEHFQVFSPTLVGTIPLNIDIPGSDLDILCEVYDFDPFADIIQLRYGQLPDFYQNSKSLHNIPSHISRFTFREFPFEIVAQPIPVHEQRAFLHMCAEARLLEQGGEPARAAIRALKLSGVKTEPAFGQYFGLTGDPYQALLERIESEN